MKRFLSLLLCLLMLPVAGLAEGQSGDQMTETVVYDAADSIGTVVNVDAPEEPTLLQQVGYTFTPLEVVMIIDVSGSMATYDTSNNRSLLDYAKQASETFSNTLMATNPNSRIGLVSFSTNAHVSCDMVDRASIATLRSRVNALSTGGGTNTGDGYRRAAELLNSSAGNGRRVVVMITDGLAASISEAVDGGWLCAQNNTAVYTIGLVGAMSESEKRTTRSVLEAGYQTAYFEVDFDNVADAGAKINEIVNSIAMTASAAQAMDENGTPVVLDVYELNLGAGFNGRVMAADGTMLSSYSADYSTSAPYGSLAVVDGRKHFVLIEGNYVIEIEGINTQAGGYTLNVLQGESMRSRTESTYTGWSHASLGWRITAENGYFTVEETGYEVLDPEAVDRRGRPVSGLEQSVGAVLNRQLDVLSAPARNAKKVSTLPQNDRIRILAESNGYYFISFVDDKSFLNRGWIPVTAISNVQGFVPVMHWLDGAYTINASGKAYGAPETDSAVVQDLRSGTSVTLKHVERSSTGEEWAYVVLRQQTPTYGYVPVTMLDGWRTIAPNPFRVGQDLPPFTDELRFEPVYFQRGQTWKVYSAPNTNSWRGARGKAEVSTNDVVYVAGWVNRGWLLVAYETNSGSRRVGYVDGKQIRGEYPEFPMLVFRNTPGKVIYNCALTDDPVNESATIRTMYNNNQVTVLSSYTYRNGYTMYYVQTTADSKTTRGFIPADCLE